MSKTTNNTNIFRTRQFDENANYDTSSYVDFLNGIQLTENGKTYDNIMNYTNEDIENDCRFIQWIFPLTEKSMFASNVPIIDINELKKEISNDRTIIDKLKKSFELMMNHWGLIENDINKIKLLNGHNALRFSRMLQSLIYHDQHEMALNAYNLVAKHFGNSETKLNILNPKILDCSNGKFDIWKFHFIKAFHQINKNN